jgi:GAF domain-containing protein
MAKLQQGETVEIADAEIGEDGRSRQIARARGWRSVLGVPMLRDGVPIGGISVTRVEPGGFDDNTVGLLKTFADQAVIAIENARLFNEVQAKTVELTDALTYQTASGNILGVIASSPGKVEPALHAIVESARKLCDAHDAGVLLKFGDDLHYSAHHGPIPIGMDKAAISRDWVTGRCVLDKMTLQVSDLLSAEGDDFPVGQEHARLQGHRCILAVPLLREGEAIGSIELRRLEPVAFSDKQVALLQSFADQAVIAIENARLFNEVQAKTRDLSEALQQQTATADVLKVISRSAFDLDAVLNTLVESAVVLSGGDSGTIFQRRGELYHLTAQYGYTREMLDYVRANPLAPGMHSNVGRTALTGNVEHIPDVLADPDYTSHDYQRVGNFRAMLGIPLKRDGRVESVFSLTKSEPGPFEPRHIELVQTFADQAAIAIENARLFNETQEALERQTATADILRVIASSPSDVQPVFDAIAERSNRLMDGHSTAVYRFINQMVELVSFTPINPEADAALQAVFPRPISQFPMFALVRNGNTEQLRDVESVEAETMFAAGLSTVRDVARARGYRSVLLTPLPGESGPIGLISVTRNEPSNFAPHHVQLLQTFADQAAIAIENARLFNETKEALERQTATADILKVIASSPSDTQPVFDAIATSANRLLGAMACAVFVFADGMVHLKSLTSTAAEVDEALRSTFPRKLEDYPAAEIALRGEIAVIADTEKDAPEAFRNLGRLRGYRSVLYAPLMNKGVSIGMIALTRAQPGAFAGHHVQLLQTFADQAVIAIENARLFNETQEALERQTATADILKVIASSPSDVQPVFDAIVHSAKRLLGGHSSGLYRIIDGMLHLEAFTTLGPEADQALRNSFPAPSSEYPEIALIEGGKSYQFADTEKASETQAKVARLRGFRSILQTPLVHNGVGTGLVAVTRAQVGPFADHHVNLMRTFADQAEIAIENVRLFNETKEALERQTATSDILEVIASSPSDVQPVFDAIAERANRLIGGYVTSVLRFTDNTVELVAFTAVSPEADAVLKAAFPMPLQDYPLLDLVQSGEVAHVFDTETETRIPQSVKDLTKARGVRSFTLAPLVGDKGPIGVISVSRREPGVFAGHHIQLLQTFADQAVIAIQNVRLFNETKEALERQTATADILKVIASSPSDVQPVFDAIATSANRLIGGFSTAVYRVIDDIVHLMAFTPTNAEADAVLRAAFPSHWRDVQPVALIQKGEITQIADAEAADALTRQLSRARGWRSVTFTPLMSQGAFIGYITCTRRETGLLADHHIQLLQTFADQAVIAIENVRLFNETKEALERQTATADILKVIASSPSDVQPVFEAIAESARRVLSGYSSIVTRVEGGELHLAAFTAKAGGSETLERMFPQPLSGSGTHISVVRGGQIVMHADTEIEGDETSRNLARARGFRSMVIVPMLRDGVPIGTIGVSKVEPHRFDDGSIGLLKTFADQAVIAIENVRLFNETQEALERQTATADILKVIASSPSDVQPVFEAIAHSAKRLLGGFGTAVYRIIDGMVCLQAFTPTTPEQDEVLKSSFPAPASEGLFVARLQQGDTVQVADAEISEDERVRQIAGARGWRSVIFTPLMNAGVAIGFISVTRLETGAFADHHVQLLKTFADQAVIAIENVRLFNETQEALERQTATADILKVIASSPSDVRPVFDAILARSLHLCEAAFGFLSVHDGERFDFAAQLGVPPALAEHFSAGMDQPRPGDAHWRLLEGEDLVHNLDQKDEDAYRSGNPLRRAVVDLGGARSALVVALRKTGSLRGSITIYRQEVRPFSESQIALLRHFADQAVIAIENTRLFNEVQTRTVELSEALEQQTATAEVLGVISSSAGDLAPVFDAMLGKAMELCSASFGVLNSYDGRTFHTEASYGLPPAYDEYRRKAPLEYGPGTAPARLLQGEPFVEVDDLANSEAYRDGEPNRRALVEIGGARCLLAVPLLKDERVIGDVMIFRQENRPFSDKQIALLQQFAAQAVIAIENTRLLRELRESTEDLTESLQQQTATSEVLQVISSSPGDLAPVFDKMLENATRVCGAEFGSMVLVEGDSRRNVAIFNGPPAFVAARAGVVARIHPRSNIAAAIRTRQVVQVEDLRNSPAYLEGDPAAAQLTELGGARTIVVVPMLRENEVIGLITVYRQEVRAFSDKQIELLTNFARQAVIAIENARLLRELRQRTDDLTEALVYQTGSSNILKVIASSPTDVDPALKAIVESACEICDANDAAVLLRQGDELALSAHHGPVPFGWQKLPINRGWISGRVVVDKVTLHVHDVPGSNEDDFPEGRELMRRDGVRTILSVPLLREGEAIGTIVLRRVEPQPFNDKQIELLKSFADQAVIAISNVRLFEEVQAKTRDLEESLQFQTASADVLKVISRSPDALQPVLEAIVETSRELCGSDASTIFLLRDGRFHFTAVSGTVPQHMEFIRANPAPSDGPATVFTRVLELKRTIHYPNVTEAPELDRDRAALGGPRALLLAPLMRDGEVLGLIVLRQSHLKPFTERQIQAIETFADQAVIAISNVNLFEQVQQRTRELSKSLDDLRTAQDRLVQTEKLASLGQLTAGIAHEIKNPLNFVNNFSALSVELTEELNDILRKAELADAIRKEIDELTGMLRDNLSRVVQHGKRADSIVKNMLLHSREGSGEHRPADVNALVEESLNLAYHGARAEKSQFNVTLRRDFDPQAGQVEVFPQEITRVLLNLISNGFYAVNKRKADNGGGDFEPLVTATTRGADDHVEIRIRDNGTGIPPEVKEKMFNPFFTTKPAGEGTGLGLSMSHDIIVKQHGGTIEVVTEPGAFTEFRVVLPRTSRANGDR